MTLKLTGLTTLISVFDMPAAVCFYRDLLGLELISHSPLLSQSPDDFHWCMLRHDGVELMLNTAYDEGQRPAQPDPRKVEAHGETVLYFACPDVDAAFAHFLGKGLKPKPPSVAPYGMRQLTLFDPDGYVLCFQWPA